MTDLSRNLNNKLDKDYAQMLFDVKYDKDQFKDPEFIGLLMYRLAKEREASNKMFKQIIKLLKEKSVVTPEEHVEILSEIDEKILALVTRQGKIDAETLQKEFKYRGKNAASARLNSLYKAKLLKKGRAGKKVLYWV